MSEAIDLRHAIQLADIADDIAKRYYLSRNLNTRAKPDKTPVTQADLDVEQALSKVVIDDFHEAYIGEEGARHGDSGKTWIVDPIDGTRNFLRGMPVWATLIAVRDAQGTCAAIVSAPALGRRWWASRGAGAWTRDVDGQERQLHVSGVATLEDAFLLHASLFTWDTTPVGVPVIMELLQQAWRHRGLGDFLNYMMVAEGAADACFEADPKEWDLAAPQLIITEAGGKVWTNAAADAPPDQPRIALSSNGLLDPLLRPTFSR
jgi:histidinol-phosphatase